MTSAEKELREEFQKFADSIVWSNNDGSEKYIGVGNMADWWMEKIHQAVAEERERVVCVVGDKWKLAKFMHERYEKYVYIFGWNTQEKTKVPFEDLPEENKKTMLAVARDILSSLQDKAIIK